MITINIKGHTFNLVPNNTKPFKRTCSLCDLEYECPPEHNICESFRRINPQWYKYYFKRNIKL